MYIIIIINGVDLSYGYWFYTCKHTLVRKKERKKNERKQAKHASVVHKPSGSCKLLSFREKKAENIAVHRI